MNAVCVSFSRDVVVTFHRQTVAQFLRTGAAAVAGKGQAFVVDGFFGRYAFGDVLFGFVGQVERVIGYAVAVFFASVHFNRAADSLTEGGLVGVDGVLGVVAFHFAADGNVFTCRYCGGFFAGVQLLFQLAEVDGIGVVDAYGHVGDGFVARVDACGGYAHVSGFEAV